MRFWEGFIGEGDQEPWRVLSDLEHGWLEIGPRPELRLAAEFLLRLHPLRAGDALQLAAALEWVGTAAAAEMVCFDRRLTHAARAEGLSVHGEVP